MGGVWSFLLVCWGVLCVHCGTYPYNNILRLGATLQKGDNLTSGTSRLALQHDGNLVVYKSPDGSPQGKALWSSGTNGKCVKGLTMTTDGDLVLTDCNDQQLWHAGTKGKGATALVLQDDCNLVLYKTLPQTDAVWATGTNLCLEAHIVAHSHDDVGWLVTPTQYYYGCHPERNNTGVRAILTTVIEALKSDPKRRFSEVEMYFFHRWWEEQSDAVKADVRALAKAGRLEFINGGWSMHDEACVHHQSAIDNMARGARFLKDEVGVDLRIGWHVDPFGHASATPRLMAQMGFDAFFFWRTDYQHREEMQRKKTLETVWKSSPSLGDRVDMFTSIMFDSYCSGCGNGACPSGLCCIQDCMTEDCRGVEIAADGFEHVWANNYTNPPKTTPSIKSMANAYANYLRGRAASFVTNHQMVPFGCDFQFQNAEDNYRKMESIMDEINGDASYGIHMFYSTPSNYIDTLHSLNYTWAVNEADYFIDSDNDHAYWSGYFSSRPAYKGWERSLMGSMHAYYQLHTLHRQPQWKNDLNEIDQLRQAMGVAQHHDSITGTEKVAVRDNYQKLLSRGNKRAQAVASKTIQAAAKWTSPPAFCDLSNISSCAATDSLTTHDVPVLLYNSLAWEYPVYVTIPVPVVGVSVTDSNGTAVTSQVVENWELTLTADPTSPVVPRHKYSVVFRATLPPLSYAGYTLKHNAAADTFTPAVPLPAAGGSISNDAYTITVDGVTGRIATIVNKGESTTFSMDQNILHYCPSAGDVASNQASGAYIFRTCRPDEKPVAFSSTAKAWMVTGPLVQEIRQSFENRSHVNQAVRLFHGEDHVEITTGVGEIDAGIQGKEVVMKFTTKMASDSTWYTDSEGLEVQERKRDSRPNYAYKAVELVAGNYFPMNAFSYLVDQGKDNGFLFVSDRSRAIASLHDGELETLVHRRLKHDDSRGVGQPLDETNRILTTNYITVGNRVSTGDLSLQARILSVIRTNPPTVFFGSPTGSPPPTVGPTMKPLPPNVHLLALETIPSGSILIRLHHIFAVKEHPTWSKPATVDLSTLLPGYKVGQVVEMDLNGVQEETSIHRLRWNTNNRPPTSVVAPRQPLVGTLVTLNPMDIRTFTVAVQ